MTMGDKIHYLRNARRLTLQELGNKVGVGASTIRKWENGMIQSVSSTTLIAGRTPLGALVALPYGFVLAVSTKGRL